MCGKREKNVKIEKRLNYIKKSWEKQLKNTSQKRGKIKKNGLKKEEKF